MGYSDNLFDSLGPLIFGLIFLVIFIGIGFIIVKLFKNNARVQKLAKKISDKLFYNTFLRMLIQGYLVFALSSFKNAKNLRTGNGGEVISSILTCIFVSILTVAPAAMFIFLKAK